ncbi:MAG: glycosyltransferase [Bacteroidaceae bacterium]|nr:glycosyltransferase [Bacteroidaceae bacterium]
MKLNRSEISRIWPIAKRRMGARVVSWVQRLFSTDRLVKNVFRENHGKRVLLCHLPEAFSGKELPKHHSNLTECLVVARCFNRLGYNVDCASRAKTGIDYAPYDVVFGINGNAFMGSFSANADISPLRIFYSVGAETCFNYRKTAMRNLEFYSRHGRWFLDSNRYMPGDPRNYYEARFSDAVICLGDRYVYEQFLEEDSAQERYCWLPAFYFKVKEPCEEKDFAACRRNILWFGSTGLLHKGLDIAIDFAAAHPEFTLHVCGSSSNEKDFWEYYRPIIKNCSNIVLHGFVDIESKEFADLLVQCGILLNPSVSEGGAVSVLNVLGNGALLPVYSRATGIDFSDNGIVVPGVTYTAFEEALLRADSLPLETFAAKAFAAHRFVREECSLEKYEERMYGYIKNIIENRKDRI